MWLALLLACAPPDDGKDTPDTGDTGAPGDSGPPGDSGDSGDPRAYADGVWSLDGTDPSLDPVDLAPLGELVGGADIVGLGEPIHFSGGFHAMRARMVPWLVEEQGFRAVAIEAPWLAAESTAAWLRDGEGDLDDAMRGLTFTVWMSTAFAGTLEWLRAWNVAHPDDPVVFWGFDMQGFYEDFPYLRAAVGAVDPVAEAALWPAVATCAGGTYRTSADFGTDAWALALDAGTDTYAAEDYTACLTGLDAVDAWLAGNAAGLDAATPDGALLAGIAARSVRAMQTELYTLYSDATASYDVRDEGMAANFADLRDRRYDGVPTVIIAHDAHLDRDTSTLEDGAFPAGWVNFGRHLTDAYGADYAPVALLGRDVTYDWGCAGPIDVRARPATFERHFSGAGLAWAILDTARATADGLVPLDDAGRTTFGNPSPSTGVLADHFGAAVYLDVSPTFEPYFSCG